MFGNHRSAARKVFVHRRVVEFDQHNPFFGAGMNDVIILEINADMAEFLPVKIEKNEVAFLQLLFVFAFDDGNLLAGHPRDINAVNLLLQ